MNQEYGKPFANLLGIKRWQLHSLKERSGGYYNEEWELSNPNRVFFTSRRENYKLYIDFEIRKDEPRLIDIRIRKDDTCFFLRNYGSLHLQIPQKSPDWSWDRDDFLDTIQKLICVCIPEIELPDLTNHEILEYTLMRREFLEEWRKINCKFNPTDKQ